MDPSLVQDSSWINLGTIFSDGFLLPVSMLPELLTLLCKPALRNSLLSRWSEIPMQSCVCLCLGRGDQAQISRVSRRSCSLTGSSARAASAPVPQEMVTTTQRLCLQTRACVLDSMVIQLLAFVNELTELVNFILKKACQVNPPASVSLNDNSIFPLFPGLFLLKNDTIG